MDNSAILQVLTFVLLIAAIAFSGLLYYRTRRTGTPGAGGETERQLQAQLQETQLQLAQTQTKLDQTQTKLGETQVGLAATSAELTATKHAAAARSEDHRNQIDALNRQLESQRQAYEERLTGLTAVRDAELKQRAQQMQAEEAEQGKILEALAPVAKNLKDMSERIVTLEKDRQEQFGVLSEQLKSSQRSGEQLRAITQSLESALRNNATRGAWGETQLRNIVEAAGLVDHVDFVTQETVDADSRQLRPDMVVKMPGGKSIPIDSKVPFASYIRANEIPANGSADQERMRGELLKEHVKALRAHIDTLASKDYGHVIAGSPDFTIAFIPSESLLSAALEADPVLLEYAFNKRVALASPVALWSVLKTVSFAWQQDTLTKEAQEVFTLARDLYRRLSTMANHTVTLGNRLSGAVQAYNKFVGSLETRVLTSARKLQTIDDSTLIAPISAVEDAPRKLTAAELLDDLGEDRGENPGEDLGEDLGDNPSENLAEDSE